MEESLNLALSPVQLAAVLSPHSVTEAEALSNRLLGGLELALGTVELMGATALCLAKRLEIIRWANTERGDKALDSYRMRDKRSLTNRRAFALLRGILLINSLHLQRRISLQPGQRIGI